MIRTEELKAFLQELQLLAPRQQYQALAAQAAHEQWTLVDYLGRLVEAECHRRREHRILRRIHAARFPVLKTLETFNWSWPKKINRTHIQNLFRLDFLETHANAVFLGGVGVGKSHLATALAHHACLEGHSVLWTSTVDMINTLLAAQAAQRRKAQLRTYLAPHLLVMDEIGYLPIDKQGADLLLQVISKRYEHESILLTTNKPFKQCAAIFNQDATLASAVLDRLLHHAHTLVIEGPSYRMKDQIKPI